MLGGNPRSVGKQSWCRAGWLRSKQKPHHSRRPAAELTSAKIPEDGPQRVAPGLRRPECWALRGRCPRRSTTAWIAIAAASSPSPQTPVWKRGSERNAGTRGSCGWSTSWYVPRSPQTQVFLSPSADAVGKCQRSRDLGVSQSCSFQQQNPLNVFRKP